MIKSTLKIARYCPLVIQGFSNFLGLFQGIMANPGYSIFDGLNFHREKKVHHFQIFQFLR